MAGYKYNPLLKEGFQKLQDIPEPPEPVTVDDELSSTSTNPVQNKVITAKLSEMEADTRKKVSKFFTSIEELEIGEIGQYQGETNETFTNGYFYKRGDDGVGINYGESQTQNFSQDIEFYRDGNLVVTQAYVGLLEEYDNVKNRETSDRKTECIFFKKGYFFSDILIPYPYNSANEGYLYPYAYDKESHSFDYDNPLSVENSQIIYKGSALTFTSTSLGETNAPIGIDKNTLIKYVWFIATTGWRYALPISINNNVAYISRFSNIDSINDYNVINVTPYSLTYQDYEFKQGVAVERIDTQPSLDPSDFATAVQGTKADTALQSIAKGTDGNYITTTVTAKDANNQQTVSASLTIQDIATADNTHKGLAEASNVKAYAATAAQGAKADTALQSISKGTDGNYITTTVTPKDANNAQTVGASLTIQDIATADNDHRGLLEALTTRNYIDNEIYKISLNFFFYGVQWDENDPSPDCTRIGNMSLHAELPIQNAIIGGLLQDNLTFTPFPNQSDWSAETVDGSAGQVMLQIPKHYFKSEIHGTIHKKLISQYPLAGFIEIPMIYVSAEKATVDRTDSNTPKLCSVVNMSPEYRGGDNAADWDNTYRTLLGKPASNISLTDFRQYARNRGNGTSWNCHTYLAQRILYWLYVTEYATLNSQKAFNAAKDANGYMQGGLGPGASNWSAGTWQAYNNYNPLIPCGYLLEYGNQSAVKNYTVKDADDNVLVTCEVNSYRGIQSPFADIWDRTDGILVNVQSDAAGGVSTCYITDDPAKFSSSDFSQYTELGNSPRADNWIKTIFDDEQGNIICKTQGNSSASYYCDYCWASNVPESGVSLRGVLFGAPAHYGSRCGFLCAASLSAPDNVYPTIGTRLCAIPPQQS